MSIPINSAFPQSGSIVSRWKLTEASGNRADSAGSNTLVDSNTVTSSTGYANGSSGVDFITDAFFTRANNESLGISDASQSGLDLSGAFTISLWVKFTTAPAAYMAVVNKWKESSGNRAYRITALGTDQSITFSMSSGGDAGTKHDATSAGSFWTTGTWVHIVGVFNPSTSIILYKNGAANTTNSTSIPSGVKDSVEAFSLGTEPENGYYLDGEMQDVIIWNTNLSGSEVTSVYNLYTVAPATSTSTTTSSSTTTTKSTSSTRSTSTSTSSTTTRTETTTSTTTTTTSTSTTRSSSSSTSISITISTSTTTTISIPLRPEIEIVHA